MIDIPIGLPEVGARECDKRAREWLGPSVFLGIRRSLLTFETYAAANKSYKERGEPGISQQLWHIRDKIEEIDRQVTAQPPNVLYETHPELVFWNLNGREILPYKKSDAGHQKRIEILGSPESSRCWRRGSVPASAATI